MIKLSRNQIAELRGVTASTVSRAHLPKTAGGDYDLSDPEVRAYVEAPAVKKAIDNYKKIAAEGYEDNTQNALDARKTEEEIKRLEKQNRKYDREHEVEMKSLIPIELVSAWIGANANGLKMFFFPIGKRVSPNNKKLQSKIEKELSKAIEKTLKAVDRTIDEEVKKMVEDIDENEN